MSFNAHLYDKLAEDHRQEIRHAMERKRLLAHSPRQRVGRRIARRLGAVLVALGTRLEEFGRRDGKVVYEPGR